MSIQTSDRAGGRAPAGGDETVRMMIESPVRDGGIGAVAADGETTKARMNDAGRERRS